jgi:hypothetical protein
MQSFLTGSRAYGQPREDSDIDMVVLVSDGELSDLVAMADDIVNAIAIGNPEYGNFISASLYFGKLNLICCIFQWQYDAWKYGTDKLKAEQLENLTPISREYAVEVIKCELELRNPFKES